MSLIIRFVTAASGNRAVVLRAYNGLIGVFFVIFGNIFYRVVYAGYVHFHSRAFHTSVDCARDNACVVQLFDLGFQATENARAQLGILNGLFVK